MTSEHSPLLAGTSLSASSQCPELHAYGSQHGSRDKDDLFGGDGCTVLAAMLCEFDAKDGPTISHCVSNPELHRPQDLTAASSNAGVELRCLPSGLHKCSRDFIVFAFKGTTVASVFVNRRANQHNRGARMASLAIKFQGPFNLALEFKPDLDRMAHRLLDIFGDAVPNGSSQAVDHDQLHTRLQGLVESTLHRCQEALVCVPKPVYTTPSIHEFSRAASTNLRSIVLTWKVLLSGGCVCVVGRTPIEALMHYAIWIASLCHGRSDISALNSNLEEFESPPLIYGCTSLVDLDTLHNHHRGSSPRGCLCWSTEGLFSDPKFNGPFDAIITETKVVAKPQNDRMSNVLKMRAGDEARMHRLNQSLDTWSRMRESESAEACKNSDMLMGHDVVGFFQNVTKRINWVITKCMLEGWGEITKANLQDAGLHSTDYELVQAICQARGVKVYVEPTVTMPCECCEAIFLRS